MWMCVPQCLSKQQSKCTLICFSRCEGQMYHLNEQMSVHAWASSLYRYVRCFSIMPTGKQLLILMESNLQKYSESDFLNISYIKIRMCLSAFPRNKAHMFLSSPTISPIVNLSLKWNFYRNIIVLIPDTFLAVPEIGYL